MRRFTGRVALVTGAANGIGRATAHRLAGEGATVVVADVETEAGTRVADELASSGAKATFLECDVTDAASVAAAVAETARVHGGLDVLVNNVGVAGVIAFEDTDDAEWNRQVEPTLHGAVRCIRAALPHLLRSEVGNVVSIGSLNGLAAFGDVAYSVAKAGLQSLTQNLAVEYSPRHRRAKGLDGQVRFNLVAPGSIRTRAWDPDAIDRVGRRYPLGRAGEPEDIANAVAFLASQDAAWITGLILPVDGGLLADGRLLLD